MSTPNNTKAITLSSFNYRDFDRITTFFTEDYGLIKVLIHSGNRPKMRFLSEPFTYMDLTYYHKKKEIHTFKEAKVLDAHLSLRDSLESLEAAFELLKITSKSQLLEEPSPKTFLLLKTYLNKIPLFKEPSTLVSSFRLKTLLLSGHWTLQTQCSKCTQTLEDFYFYHLGYYCKRCAPSQKLHLDLDEVKSLSELINERSFSALEKKAFSKTLSKKIETMWQEVHP